MKTSNPSIRFAKNKETGEIVDSNEIFKTYKNAHDIREQYSRDKVSYVCLECGKDLVISKSVKDKMFFKHKNGHHDCILSLNNLSDDDCDSLMESARYRESARHKELKNIIGERLKKIDGVDIESICIDSKYIIDGNNRRKPDVYCKYRDVELAFEIQISDLSHKYILDRHDFYKKQGIYLIWILDDFDIHSQGRLEKDIKYLGKYHNYFKVNESNDSLLLHCDYKVSYLTAKNEQQDKWEGGNIALSDLKFDKENMQTYFLNYPENKRAIGKEKIKIDSKEQERIEKQELEDARDKVRTIIKRIKQNKHWNNSLEYNNISNLISNFNDIERREFNEKCNFRKTLDCGRSLLIKWIDESNNTSFNEFILFVLRTKEIDININQADADGRTAFQAIMENEYLSIYDLRCDLFKRGYTFQSSDSEYLSKREGYKDDVWMYELCEKLKDKNLADKLFEYRSLVSIIESAFSGKIIDSKLPNLVAYGNNVIQHHSKYWNDYIKPIFEETKFMDKILKSDKKGTFAKKIKNIKNSSSDISDEENAIISELIDDLYLEIRYLLQFTDEY